MPSKSPKQAKLMRAAAHNPEFAAKVDIPQSVAKEFMDADMAEDSAEVGSVRVIEKTKSEVESLVISETQHKALPIDYLMGLRGPFIAKRDEILDNPLRYYNPFYRKELRRIDAKLDTIDILIHALESQTNVKESDLNTVISRAEERLTECFKLLGKK